MAGLPSVGDILMLSQLAWRIGRTFTAGKQDAPDEFHEVELEVNSLSKSLKLLAEALFANPEDNILARANDTTKMGMDKLLNSCRQTLQDLDSLVNEYQVTIKTNTASGFIVERLWSPMVLSNYQSMMWTPDGANITTLRDILRMHRNSLNMTIQALKTKSIQNLEATVTPIAEKIDLIHGELLGDINQTIEEVRRIVTSVSGGTSSPTFPDPYGHPLRTSSRVGSPQATAEPLRPDYFGSASLRRHRSVSQGSRATHPEHRVSVLSAASSRSSSRPITPRSSAGKSPLVPVSPNFERRPSKNVASDLPVTIVSPKSIDLEHGIPSQRNSASTMDPLPLPAIPVDTIEPIMSNLSLVPDVPTTPVKLTRTMTSASQQSVFEKAAFRNSAVLCDVRGVAIEYTRPTTEDIDPFGVELVEAMEKCRICVVRKRETMADKQVRMTTSIWAFSHDGAIRMEQKLEDGIQYIPYSSFFQQEKISLAVPAELRFHDVTYGSRLLKTAKTTWINYILQDLQSAALFQNELMARILIATFKTEKTIRLHEGLSGVLAYQEQMCGMENLRVWEDENTGGVFAMIHFSAQFRIGYLTFWINSSSQPVRVKDDGGKEVKIKGLKIPAGEGNLNMMRKDSGAGTSIDKSRKGSDGKKMITGAKIEFSHEGEKYAFLKMVKEIQTRMRILPDLS